MLSGSILVTTTAQSLYDLIVGNAELTDRPQEGFSMIRFEAVYPANTNAVYIGTAGVDATNYSATIPAGLTMTPASGQGPYSIEFGHDATDLSTRTLFLVSVAGSQAVKIWLK